MKSTTKFPFLDGLRGLCALYVVLYHAQLFTGHGIDKEKYSPYVQPINYFLSFGHYSVAVFIVLSGFCLTIPVAVTPDRSLKGTFYQYIKRRANRILPPYYFALAFSIVLLLVFPVLQIPHDTAWDSKLPITGYVVLSHLFLVHNFSLDWINKLNGPLWSVATEWQIYFLFPVLLAMWRSSGLWIAVAAAMLLGLLPWLLLPSAQNFFWLHPWYVGLFAIGMLAAVIAFSAQPYWTTIRIKIPWQFIAYVAGITTVLFLTIGSQWLNVHTMVNELIVGTTVSIWLIYYSLLELKGTDRSKTLTLLNSSRLVFIGSFSYSIYLIHSPLLALINLSTLDIALSSTSRFLFMIVGAVPFAIACSFLFYLLIERRFMPSRPNTTSQQENKPPTIALSMYRNKVE